MYYVKSLTLCAARRVPLKLNAVLFYSSIEGKGTGQRGGGGVPVTSTLGLLLTFGHCNRRSQSYQNV